MTDEKRFKSRKEAAEFWDAHSIDEVEGKEIEVEVKKPLSAILTLRLDPDHLQKLKLLAKAQDIGVTTMARRILEQALERPESQLFPQALGNAGLRRAVADIMAESQIPPDTEEPVYYLVSKESLEHIGRMVSDTAHQLFIQALQEKSVAVTEREEELYDKIKQLADVNR